MVTTLVKRPMNTVKFWTVKFLPISIVTPVERQMIQSQWAMKMITLPMTMNSTPIMATQAGETIHQALP